MTGEGFIPYVVQGYFSNQMKIIKAAVRLQKNVAVSISQSYVLFLNIKR